MRSSWVIWVGPKSHDKCHTEERHAEGRGEGHVKTEAETGVMQPQPRNNWGHQNLEEARKDSL